MSTENELQIPIVETIGGEEITFPRLDLADLIQWMGEIKARRRSEADLRAKQDTMLSPFDRQRLLQIVDDKEIELIHVLSRAYTPLGIQYVLMKSLGKAKIPAEKAKAILSLLHFRRQADLADKILSAPEPPKPPKGDGSENPPPSDTEEPGQEIAP